jgi:phenylalanine-4-hydroxylase
MMHGNMNIKFTSVAIDNVPGWSPDQVWAFLRRKKFPHSAWIRTQITHPVTLDTISSMYLPISENVLYGFNNASY